MTDYTITMSPTPQYPNGAVVRWDGSTFEDVTPRIGRWFEDILSAQEWVAERKAVEGGYDATIS